jgi:hypothetical protein
MWKLFKRILAMKKNKLLFILIATIVSFFCITNISKSDNTMVWYSDSKFLYSWTEVDIINFELSWWIQTWFTIKIYNKENISMTYKLWSVDAGKTNDSMQYNTCLSENETWIFWQYILWDKTSKTIPAWWSWTWNLTAQFPNYYSWTYTWCITFFPSIVWWTTVDTLPRRWNFISATIHPVWINLDLKAFASSRVSWLTNSWTIKIYNTSKVLQKTINVWVNINWTWSFFTDIIPGTYYIIFKWQSHLASYLSWVILLWWNQTLDFTTWTNLYGAQNYSSQQDDWNKYQTAGDLKNTQWNYDFTINWNDITIITINWLSENWINIWDPRNLNWDIAVNVSDISIVWTNFAKKDAYFYNTFNR